MSIQDVAKEVHLDWHTVKALEKQYMREQLRRTGVPAPKAIGIDEISLRKGHTYRIVVSDLLRRRPPSGLEAKTARRRAWMLSMNALERRSVRGFALR
jgi:transposase